MKKSLIIVVAAVLMVASSIQAQTIFGNTADSSWFNAANWNNGIPDDSEYARIAGKAVVDASGATSAGLDVGFYNVYSVVTILNNCNLSSSGNVKLGGFSNQQGVITNNGTFTTIGVTMQGYESILVNNGTINASSIIMGHLASTTSLFTNTGVVNISDTFAVSRDSAEPAIFNMNGGLMVINELSQTLGDGHSIINLNDGIISNVTANLDGSSNCYIVVDNGKMYINGNYTAAIDNLISLGLITGKGSKTAYSSFDGTTTRLSTIPEPATIGLLAVLGLAFLRKK